MRKYSSGPWKAKVGDKDRRAMSMITKANDPAFTIAHVVCEAHHVEQREEDIANAHLIAAAPELLDALLSILGTTELNVDEMEYSTLSAIENAREIIAKATGEL